MKTEAVTEEGEEHLEMGTVTRMWRLMLRRYLRDLKEMSTEPEGSKQHLVNQIRSCQSREIFLIDGKRQIPTRNQTPRIEKVLMNIKST